MTTMSELLIGIVCFLAMACAPEAALSVNPAAANRQQSAVHRDFVVEDDPAAVRMLEERLRTAAADGLSEHYDHAGYATMAELYGGAVSESPRPSPSVRWQCPLSDDQDTGIQDRVEQIAAIRQAGNYAQAMAAAREALRLHPDSCELRVEWAAATLMAALVNRSSVPMADQERAVRTLVTAAAEVVMVPEGYIGGGQVLRDVAWYFMATGDTSARHAALLIARRMLVSDQAATQVPELKDANAKLIKDVDRQLAE